MSMTRWALTSLSLVLLASAVTADQPPSKSEPPKKADPPAVKEAERVEAVVVVAGKTVALKTKTGQPARSVVNSKNNIARVNADPANPSRMMLQGLKAGVSRVTITYVGGGIEVLFIAVEAADEVAP